MIKAIVFDFVGVITPGIIYQWVKDLKKTDPRYKLFSQVSHQWDLGDLTIDAYYQAISQITKIPQDKIRTTFYQNATVYEEVITIIKVLKKQYKIVLFTNNFSHNVERYFDVLQLHTLFDEVIISSEHKVKKPDPIFYEIMLSQVGVEKEEVIFFDDKKENIDAAKKLGMKAFVYTHVDKLKQDLLSENIHI